MAHNGTKSDAIFIAKKLRDAGFTALLAGGCVRDILMGTKPKDYDIATDARPEQIEKLFSKVLMVGAQFGVAMVIRGGRVTECATFRAEAEYSDGRRPDSIEYTDAKADALRRDFTINGMFMDPISDEIYDYVGGRQDIESRIIRAIGDAEERFSEDFLRVLRAVRFAARLDFTLEYNTEKAICKNVTNLSKISGERILEELTKIFSSPNYISAMEMIKNLGMADEVFTPELSLKDNWEKAVARLKNLDVSVDIATMLGCILADMDKKNITKICSRWGASNKLKGAIQAAAKHIDHWHEVLNWQLCELKPLVASENFKTVFQVWQTEQLRLNGNTNTCDLLAEKIAKIPADQISPQPYVTGADLMKMGLGEGPLLGKILKAVYDMQLNEQFTDRDQAIKKAAELINQQP